MPEQRLVPTRQLTEVADCLEAMATGKGGWAWADVLDELRAIIDGPGVELPPQYPKQAKTMLICDGEDVSPAEVGHWFSPEYIAELLAAPSAPAPAETMRDAVRDAIAAALGDAYDCTRVWDAWNVGTMTQDDFVLVCDDESRLYEIADAAISAMLAVAPQPPAKEGDE